MLAALLCALFLWGYSQPAAGADRCGAWSGPFNLSLMRPLVPPPSDALLQDDFTAAAIDASKWNANTLFSGFTDRSISISQTGQLVIGPLLQGSAASGSHYRGVASVN